jgi:hypothetical protein
MAAVENLWTSITRPLRGLLVRRRVRALKRRDPFIY